MKRFGSNDSESLTCVSSRNWDGPAVLPPRQQQGENRGHSKSTIIRTTALRPTAEIRIRSAFWMGLSPQSIKQYGN